MMQEAFDATTLKWTVVIFLEILIDWMLELQDNEWRATGRTKLFLTHNFLEPYASTMYYVGNIENTLRITAV